MEIREARIEEHETIADFQLRLAFETEDLELDRETVVKGAKAVFEDAAKGKYYVTLDKDKVIACLMVTFEWSDWRNGWTLWIQSLYVLGEYRKKGVFKSMYGHLQKIVSTNDEYKGIRLYVDITNTKARKAYQSIGMDGDHYKLFESMK